MSKQLSPQWMFEQMALSNAPRFAFKDHEKSGFAAWKAEAWPAVLAALGEMPPRVAPNPQLLAQWNHEELLKERWLIEVGPYSSATFQINYPVDFQSDSKYPTLFCWHGHGPFGKEAVMGNRSSPELRANIAAHNYDYGHQMAKNGFITYAIDWIGIGERNDNRKPNWRNMDYGREWCDLYYLLATMLGTTTLAINVVHGMVATDFACTLPGVDANRLGVMGLSGGGTMTTWTALCDERFRAAEIICYSDLWAVFGYRDVAFCGMQVAPGLFKLVDLPDLQGLIAPRPLLIDIGVHDDCFVVDSAMKCYHQIEKIYAAAGASGNLELDLFPDGHRWGGNKSVEFFTRHLK